MDLEEALLEMLGDLAPADPVEVSRAAEAWRILHYASRDVGYFRGSAQDLLMETLVISRGDAKKVMALLGLVGVYERSGWGPSTSYKVKPPPDIAAAKPAYKSAQAEAIEALIERLGPQGVRFIGGRPLRSEKLPLRLGRALNLPLDATDTEQEVQAALAELASAGKVKFFSVAGRRVIVCTDSQEVFVQQALDAHEPDPVDEAQLSYLMHKAWRLLWNACENGRIERSIDNFMVAELGITRTRMREVRARLALAKAFVQEQKGSPGIYKFRPPDD